MNLNNIKFVPCEWDEIKPAVSGYYTQNRIIIDSFLEFHITTGNHYKMEVDGKIEGFFAIHGGSTITLFNVYERFANVGQELFARIKKYEQVTNAMVTTGDEFFLSHALDNFARMEKQAYFAVYTDKPTSHTSPPVELSLADIEKDKDCLALCGDFLDKEIDGIKNGETCLEIYIAKSNGTVVGFGVIEYSTITNFASIGMYVLEEMRMRGWARSILLAQRRLVESKGRTAVSGCWYYNHNSKKSMESSGAYSKTRLLRFYF